MRLLDIKNLKFGYDENLILDDINLSLDDGDFIAISGENGSGKSTLIKLILKVIKKDSGEIKLLGKPIEEFTAYEKIGYVPQVNDSSKISFPVTCKEYVSLGLYKEFNIFNMPTRKVIMDVKNVFQSLAIEKLLDKPFRTLSGGQQQRVMIARALVSTPQMLILDEPTVGIDAKHKEDFLKLLGHLNRDHGISILIISHEMELIKNYVTKTVYLKEGRLVDA
ncbi:metal ABC transporter ATP-binding protein [uncultured Anaerococcus sp.]|uniref:metal ABC transporter ATP-binding protein n=1 Tax=uncultured Anaerococcus sp. TaxID=293428 RepID=UPI0026384BD3|nr:ATP-binding cassette domain-containing protein [uncultured Anaerococcus sp.]